MIPATQAHSQRTWFQRITQERFSHRFCKCFCLFYTGLIILFLEITVMAFFSDHAPFFVTMAMIVPGIIFAVITGGMALYELCQNPEEYTTLRLEESARRQTAQGHPEDFETEAATASTGL